MQRSMIGLVTCAGFALACGGDDPAPRPSAQAMLPSAASATAGAGDTSSTAGSSVPVISRVALSPAVPVPGTEMRAVVEASDPDGDLLRFHYVWTHNGREVGNGPKSVLYLVDLEKGDRIEVKVTASDGVNQSEPMMARASTGNRPPVLSAVTLEPFGDIRAGEVISATPHALDPDNDRLDFRYRWTVNGDARGRERTFDTTGLHRGDQIQAWVVADDGRDQSREVSSPILMLGNSPPVISRLPSEQFDDGTFRYTFAAKDPDGDRNLRFFVEKGPEGMRMDAISGVLTWTPTASQAGVHPIEVGVKDGKGEGSTFTFELTVRSTTPAAPAARR
jgi:hypothetical protein